MSAAPVLPSIWASALAKRSTSGPAADKTAADKTAANKTTVGGAGSESSAAPPPAAPIETLAFYRKHTEALLRKYLQKSMEMGRTPSILDNCMFRGMVSSYRLHTFEEIVIFVLDVDRCLKRLDKPSQELIARIALQEYSQGETAALTGQSLRSVSRRYAEAIDALTAILLDCELLSVEPGRSCQGGRNR